MKPTNNNNEAPGYKHTFSKLLKTFTPDLSQSTLEKLASLADFMHSEHSPAPHLNETASAQTAHTIQQLIETFNPTATKETLAKATQLADLMHSDFANPHREDSPTIPRKKL